MSKMHILPLHSQSGILKLASEPSEPVCTNCDPSIITNLVVQSL